MDKKAKILLIAMAATGVAACNSNDDGEEATQPPVVSRPITIEVTENPMVSENPANSRETRAAVTTMASFSEFSVDYDYTIDDSHYQSSTPFSATKTNGKWEVKTTGIVWPAYEDSKTVNWYAHTAGTNRIDGTVSSFNYTVEEASANQKDLLVAKMSDTYTHSKGKLKFTFDHVCSAVQFYVKKANNISSYNVKISEVKLYKVVKTGEYRFDSSSWELGTKDNDITCFTLFSSSSKVLGSDYSSGLLNCSENDYLFLLPQTLTAWNPTKQSNIAYADGSFLEINCTITGSNDSEVYSGLAYIPFAGTFKQGTEHEVYINIGKNSLYTSEGNKIVN